MYSFRSFVERTAQLRLQHVTHYRTPIPLLGALIVFTSFSIVGRAPSTSLSAFAATLGKTLTKPSTSEGIPLLNSLLAIFSRALTSTCLRVRIHVKVPIQWWRTFRRGDERAWSCDTYATPRAEATYWRVAGRYRRRLYGGGDTTTSARSNISKAGLDGTVVPLVTYYTPRLLPLYRDRSGGKKRTSREAHADAQAGGAIQIPPRTFCKWHRMVFPGSCHPTLAQAAARMKYYSNRDLREIQRIARLLRDEEVFGRRSPGARGRMKYREMWRDWLENKGADIVIVFE